MRQASGTARQPPRAWTNNATAYEPAAPRTARRRGRPKGYGRKIKLRDLFGSDEGFVTAPSSVYGERSLTLRYRALDLLWRPLGRLVRFVLVDHPTRGRLILLCTDTTLDALAIIQLYVLLRQACGTSKPAWGARHLQSSGGMGREPEG